MDRTSTTLLLVIGGAVCLPFLAPRLLGAAETVAPTAASQSGASCGNGLLDAGETCASCAADCTPQACDPGERRSIALAFTAPKEAMGGDVRSFTPVAATITLSYRTNRLHLPGKGTEPAVGRRVTRATSATANLITNDLDYALRVIATDAKMLPSTLATIEFDTCKGAPAPVDADVSCVVEACAGHGGPLADCYCTATLAPPAAPPAP